MKSLFHLAIAGIAIVLISSCETTTSASGASSPSKPAAKKSSGLVLGRKLYYGRCTSCHAAEPPNYYTKSEWRQMVGHMRKRAKLTPPEEAALLKFLFANAASG